MQKYVLSCSSTADMPREYFEGRGIPYVCFHFNIDGQEYSDDLGQSVPFDEFYKKITDGAMPTTSQVNVEQYTEFFDGLLAAGNDVLHITFSSGLSGSYNSARIAAEEVLPKYPGRKLYIVDSLAASSGYGLLMDMAADKRDEGMELEALRDWVLENRLKVHHWFFSTNLMHYFRGGRVSKTSAVLGTMLNICPLLNVSNEGKLLVRQKVRGKSNVIAKMVDKMKEFADDGAGYSGKCFISQSACYEDARKVADMVEEAFPNLAEPVKINSIGTVIGSHTGPGTVALFFVGSARTD